MNGHIRIGPIVIYGSNAMHWATNIHTPWGILCFRPTVYDMGRWWRWYIYLSIDGTPCNPSMRWGIGPGLME